MATMSSLRPEEAAPWAISCRGRGGRGGGGGGREGIEREKRQKERWRMEEREGEGRREERGEEREGGRWKGRRGRGRKERREEGGEGGRERQEGGKRERRRGREGREGLLCMSNIRDVHNHSQSQHILSHQIRLCWDGQKVGGNIHP